MLVRLEGKGRLNQRLFRGLRRAIVERRLAPASRLPSTRALAADLGVSRNVVLLAFAQLVAEGYADGRGGSGTFVATTLPDPHLEARAARAPATTDWIESATLGVCAPGGGTRAAARGGKAGAAGPRL